jgi:hypothetical protein
MHMRYGTLSYAVHNDVLCEQRESNDATVCAKNYVVTRSEMHRVPLSIGAMRWRTVLA